MTEILKHSHITFVDRNFAEGSTLCHVVKNSTYSKAQDNVWPQMDGEKFN